MKYEYMNALRALWNLSSVLERSKKPYHLSGSMNILSETKRLSNSMNFLLFSEVILNFKGASLLLVELLFGEDFFVLKVSWSF